jgi:hypothetical protein
VAAELKVVEDHFIRCGGGEFAVIVGMGSDGCAPRRKVMLQRLCASDSVYGLDDPTFKFRGAVRADRTVYTIDSQCFRHAVKRLLNQLKQQQRALQMGEHVITVAGCWAVMQEKQNESRLRLGDVNRDDRQSVDSAQRMAMHRVVNALNGDPKSEYCGLRWYLDLVGEFFDVFLSNHHTAAERVLKASHVYHSFLAWRRYVDGRGDLSLARNFITNVTLLDVAIALHSAVNAIRLCRDHSTMSLMLECLGEDCCERLFRFLGNMYVSERSFTNLDAHRRIGNLNGVTSMTADGMVKMPTAIHHKGDIIWHQNYPDHPPKPASIESKDVPTDAVLLAQWVQGRDAAISDMKCKFDYTITADDIVAVADEITRSFSGDDGQGDADEADDFVRPHAEDDRGTGDDDEAVDERVVDNVVRAQEIDDNVVPVDEEAPVEAKAVDLPKGPTTVIGPDGRHLNIVLLVSLLNHNVGNVRKVSAERLVRVQTKYDRVLALERRTPSAEELAESSRLVYLGCSVACVLVLGRVPTPYVGTVHKIVVTKSGKKRDAVNFDLSEQSDECSAVFTIKFLKEDAGAEADGPHVFRPCNDEGYASDIPSESVLFRVTFKYDPDSKTYELSREYMDEMREQVKALNKGKR